MKRKLWVRSFSEKDIPKYPCPNCSEQTLRLAGKVDFVEPAHSRKNHGHDDFEPEWIVERGSFRLICETESCGEVVNATAELAFEYEVDEDGFGGLTGVVRPTSFSPAPPMIEMPDAMPMDASRALEAAFAVCWVDTGGAANRIRASVELSLDALGVPRSTVSKKSGKAVDLDLNGRIQWLEKQTGPKKDHASTFQALRVAGNAGSHGVSTVSWNDFLDCLLLYEAALEDIFGLKSDVLEKAKQRLLKLKKPKKT